MKMTPRMVQLSPHPTRHNEMHRLLIPLQLQLQLPPLQATLPVALINLLDPSPPPPRRLPPPRQRPNAAWPPSANGNTATPSSTSGERENKEASQTSDTAAAATLPHTPTSARRSPQTRTCASSSSSSHIVHADSNSAASPTHEHKTSVDHFEQDGGNGEGGDGEGEYDETRAMTRIAELDAMLEEADKRSAEMSQRLADLMSEPLSIPDLPPIDDAENEYEENDDEEDSPATQTTSPSTMQRNAFQSQSSPNANRPNDADIETFITSVPGAAPSVPPSSARGSSSSTALTTTDSTKSPTTTTDESKMLQMEEAEEEDAPLVLGDGEGFRPSRDDLVKLEEIDALLDHFRAGDISLPGKYRPRFLNPPSFYRQKKPSKRKTRKSKQNDDDKPETSQVLLVQNVDGDNEPEGDDDGDGDGESVAASTGRFSPSSLASRIAQLTHSITAVAAAASSSTDGTPESDFGLAQSSLEWNEEDRQELYRLNKQLARIQKRESSTARSAQEKGMASAAQITPDALQRLLDKTQQSTRMRSVGGDTSTRSNSTDATDSFPLFSFPTSSPFTYKSITSTDAILDALLEEEDRAAEAAGGSSSSASSRRSARKAAAHEGSRRGETSDDTVAREMASAVDDEDEYDSDADDLDGGEADQLQATNVPTTSATTAGEDIDPATDLPRDPRARIERLAAQVAAIRARLHTDQDDIDEAQQTQSTRKQAENVEPDATKRSKRKKHHGSSDASTHTERVSSAGVPRVSSTPSSHASLPRPRSDPASPGFDLDAPRACPPVPSPSASSISASTSSLFHERDRSALSLSERLDLAIGVNPHSRPSTGGGSGGGGSGRGGAADSWRAWKATAAAAGGGNAMPEVPLGSAAMARAAARGTTMQQQPPQSPMSHSATPHYSPSPRQPPSSSTSRSQSQRSRPDSATSLPALPLRPLSATSSADVSQPSSNIQQSQASGSKRGSARR